MSIVRATLILVLLTGAARAQVLHERVNIGVKCTGGVCTSQAGAPVAVDQNGQLIYAPHDSVQPKPNEPVYTPKASRVEAGGAGASSAAGGDVPPERRDVIHPDRETGPEPPGKHYYHEVFDPAVFPYKRMTALDGVELGPCAPAKDGCQEEQLVVRDAGLQELRVGGHARADHDSFWGSIVVDLEPGRWLPIPTPGAPVSVLNYQTTPAVELTFAHDSADNLYVRAERGGRHRLTYLVSVPAIYFGGEVNGARVADEPAALLPQMPPATRERAREFLARAHIDSNRNLPLRRVLDPMVAWFRAFETGDLPSGSGNSYFDLACSQKGCCRHRSYAFAITAMAAGIPARYVENELHVFVEVYVPGAGWRRINLGGALLDEEVLNADDKTPHQPRGGDPFPQPPAYSKNAKPPGPHDSPSSSASSSSSASGGSTGGGGRGTGPGPATMSQARGDDLPYVDLDRLPVATTARPGARSATSIALAPIVRDAFRGEAIEVAGSLGENGGGLPVEIYLQGPSGALRVGAATTEADGSFHAAVELPKNLPLGDHRVVVRTPGDDKRAASRSR